MTKEILAEKVFYCYPFTTGYQDFAKCVKIQNKKTAESVRRGAMATVFERVRSIVVDQLGVEEDQVVPSASFVDDLNADSLDLVELIMTMEEEFTKDGKVLEISDEEAEKLATVQAVVDFLKDKGVEDE